MTNSRLSLVESKTLEELEVLEVVDIGYKFGYWVELLNNDVGFGVYRNPYQCLVHNATLLVGLHKEY